MNVEHLCMGCMFEKGSALTCPQCGWEEGTPQESSQQLPPRTLLNDRYYLGRVLGQGGFGITYLAVDTFLDMKLAVKEYFPRDMVSREAGSQEISIHSESFEEQYSYALEKFLLEARTLARFEGHPNIISVRDFFKANGTAYLVMIYLEGITLKEYLDLRSVALPFRDALAIIMPVLDALKAVHEQGVLHRDISPDNIFMSKSGRVVLIDFGAARQAIGEKGKHLSVVLKPGYAPEEQYRSKGVQGPWTDIYAVAATFYRAITGRMAPESLDRMEEDLLLPPSYLGVQIGPREEEALLKALAVRGEDRFQAVEQFQEALWSASSGPAAPPAAVEERPEGGIPGEDVVPPVEGHEQTQAHLASPFYPLPVSRDMTEEPSYPPADSPPFLPADSAPHPFPGHAVPPVDKINIGRAPDNDIVLEDNAVSRYHACIFFHGGKWYLADRGSTHGTFLDDRPVGDAEELRPGNRVRLSGVTLALEGNQLLSEQGSVLQTLGEPVPPAPSAPSPPSRHHAAGGKKQSSGLLSSPGKVFLFVGAILGALILAAVFALSSSFWQGVPPRAPGGAVNHDTVNDRPGEANEIEVGPVDPALWGAEEAGASGELKTGTIEFSGGVYTGELKGGLPHGYGTLVYPRQHIPGLPQRGERKYVGYWKDGKKHGEGTMHHPEGSIQHGLWDEDVFIGR